LVEPLLGVIDAVDKPVERLLGVRVWAKVPYRQSCCS
jgi:hypothetical protein